MRQHVYRQRTSPDTCFNPRTREGCDNYFLERRRNCECFNPRTREGCDSLTRQKRPAWLCFNPRTREGCDMQSAGYTDVMPMFQSTHPRGVRQKSQCPGRVQSHVSIHAPARGATKMRSSIVMHGDVSIHAPARGATDGEAVQVRFVNVSIHAPARGATFRGCPLLASFCLFQSTHPRGVRHLPAIWNTPEECFNPRTREGCDSIMSLTSIVSALFQSTHPRGVRPDSILKASAFQKFQSTHPRGVRHLT